MRFADMHAVILQIFITLLEKSCGNPDTKILVFREKKRTVIGDIIPG